jgi:hypothetical protein
VPPPYPGAVTTLACLLPFVALGALWVVGALCARRSTGSTSLEITLSCQEVLQLAGQEYDRDISSIVFCRWWTKRPLDWAELTDACRGSECRQRGELVAHPLPKPTSVAAKRAPSIPELYQPSCPLSNSHSLYHAKKSPAVPIGNGNSPARGLPTRCFRSNDTK